MPEHTMSDTAAAVALWEGALQHSDGGRFHDAVVGFEQARCILSSSATTPAGGGVGGGGGRLGAIVAELVVRVSGELKDHYALLEGNHFLVLGLKRPQTGATALPLPAKAVRQAYRAFVLRYHPDKNVTLCDTSALFRCGQVAYEVLSDPEKAAAYAPSILPVDWLQKRAADTRRLAAQEQLRWHTENRKETTASTAAEPRSRKDPREASDSSVPRAAAKVSGGSQRSDGHRWLGADELQGLKVSDLVAALAAAGLMRSVQRGAERGDLEALYLDAARDARGGRAHPQPRAEAKPSGGSGRPGGEQKRASKDTAPRHAQPPPSSSSSAPAAPFGGRVTKDALRRQEERMFGGHRSRAEAGREAGPQGGTAVFARDDAAGDAARSGIASQCGLRRAAVGRSSGDAAEAKEGPAPRTPVDQSKQSSSAGGASDDDDDDDDDMLPTVKALIDDDAPAPAWGKPRIFLGAEDDEDEDTDDNEGATGDFAPAWGRPNVYFVDDEEADDEAAHAWDFAFDVSALRWGSGGEEDDNEDDEEDGEKLRGSYSSSAINEARDSDTNSSEEEGWPSSGGSSDLSGLRSRFHRREVKSSGPGPNPGPSSVAQAAVDSGGVFWGGEL